MDFNYTKIRLGNWLYKYCFPLYNFTYRRFKLRNDRQEIAQLKKHLGKGAHVLDIGANIGFYAEVLSNLVGPTGKVYCFEPDQTNFRHLKKNTERLKNVLLFNSAVSDKPGNLKVYRSKLLNVDHRTYPVNNYDSIEEIGAITIDELMEEGALPKVNFIKIDIQGYELAAFKGMKQLLTETPHLKIMAEYWPHGFKRAGTSAVEFFDFFTALKYSFYLMDGDSLSPITREYVEKNNDKPFEFSFNVLIMREN
jgi:FkbM family methyltransferase